MIELSWSGVYCIYLYIFVDIISMTKIRIRTLPAVSTPQRSQSNPMLSSRHLVQSR